MKSPQDMRIIQIDITNACIHKCSNCTRFCGHHKKPFFMDFETFKKAIDSMEGYHGTIGIMGGEPTLHPEFERFLNYANEHKYYSKAENLLLTPTKNFMQVVARMEQNNTFVNKENGVRRWCVEGYGLWSALSDKYREHYELIQDTFNYQALNDHTNIMYHAPIMIRRKDMGISDEEWVKMRDNCWAQAAWSATITPKGAFFCEIAGALDMLFDGPGGWPIEPGWWKRTPDQFGEQLKWCELCGIVLNTFTRDANEEIDDMSEWYYEALKKLGSPKALQGHTNVLKITEKGKIAEESKVRVKEVRKDYYTDSYYSRFNENNDWLNLKGIIELNVEEPDLGRRINKAIAAAKKGEFILLHTADSKLKEGYVDYLKEYILNPGTILVADETYDMEEILGSGVCAIFSPKAFALKKATFPRIAQIETVQQLVQLWDKSKCVPLVQSIFCDETYRIDPDMKYAFYGVGIAAKELMENFSDSQVMMVSDTDPEKWGKEFCGYTIVSPDELFERKEEFQKIFVGSRHYIEIRAALVERGFNRENIVTSLLTI